MLKSLIDFFLCEGKFISYKKEGIYCLKLYCENCGKKDKYDLPKGCEFNERHTNQYGTWGSKIKVGYWEDGYYGHDENEDVNCKNCGDNSLIRL